MKMEYVVVETAIGRKIERREVKVKILQRRSFRFSIGLMIIEEKDNMKTYVKTAAFDEVIRLGRNVRKIVNPFF